MSNKTKSQKELLKFLDQAVDLQKQLIKMNGKSKEAFFYQGYYDFISQEGQFYTAQELSQEEQAIVEMVFKQIKKQLAMGFCFSNSQIAILNDESGKLKYHEGVVHHEDFLVVIHHGWNTINGKVIDFTLNSMYCKDYPSGKYTGEYYGFELKDAKKWILDRISSGKDSSSYLANYGEGLPALKTKHIR